MLLVYGHPASQLLRLWECFEVKAIMLNAYQLSRSKKLMRELEKGKSLREVLGVPEEVELWLDSGGYQAMRRGVKLEPDTVIKWYNLMKPDYCVALDSPIKPNDPHAEGKVERNVEVAKYMYGKVNCSLLPVYHPVPEDLLEEYASGYSEVGERVAVGGLIPRILSTRNSSRKEGWEFLKRVREVEGRWLHALGLGSALLIPKLKEMNYQSADTQTWRHKAAYGKIMLPGRGERHITDREVNFGKKKISEDEVLEAVSIAKRLGIGWDELKRDFKKRAIFNAYVLHVVAGGST
jgi:hypothetical protein